MRRFAALLLVAFAAPLLAADPIWALQQAIADRVSALEASDAVVAASIPDATGEPTVTVLPCQCGDVCECADCDCPGCPHRAVKDCLTAQPPLVITSAVAGCPPCERFKRDALPRLQAAGWVEGKDYAVRLVPLGSETVPSFAYRGELFTQGYGGWSDWRAKLVTAMGEPERVTHDAQRHGVAKPVQAHHVAPQVMRSDYHVHVCRSCGNSWSHHDSNAGNAAAHRCQRCGAYEYQIRSHSGPGPAGGAPYSQPAYRSGGCHGGVCPPRSRGLFGGLFR